MPTTLAELRTDLRARLDEATPTFWDDVDLDRWLNEGVREVARRTEALLTNENINIVVGAADYILPDDVIRVYRVEYRPDTTRVHPLEYRELHSLDNVWGVYRGQQAEPRFFTLWGVTPTLTMTVYPTPDRSVTNGFKLFYYRMPAAMTTGTSTVDLPEGWQELPVLYAEYVALRKDKQREWQEAKGEFERAVSEMSLLTNRLSNQVGHYAGESMRSTLPAWLVESDY